MDAALERLALVDARERRELLHQARGRPLGEEAARAHRVDEQGELGEVEAGLLHRVLDGRALDGGYGAPELTQGVEVAVDALALGRYAEPLEPLQDLGHGQAVLGVGFLVEHSVQVEELELLFPVGRHGNLPSRALGGANRVGTRLGGDPAFGRVMHHLL